MKTDFLAGLGIDEKAIPQIMAENGKDIERAKEKFADYDDLLLAARKRLLFSRCKRLKQR